MTSEVSLSVIVASYNSAASIRRCLESLRPLQEDERFEVIVVDSSVDGTARMVKRDFPSVRLLESPKRLFAGDARNLGIAVARGHIIAFVDADCIVPANWGKSVVRAHRDSAIAIGGSVGSAEPCRYVAWASYFCEFSRWMPNTAGRWMDDVAGAGMSYKRTTFERFGRFIEGTYCSDTELHWRMVDAGQRIRFTPDIRVDHRSLASPGMFLRHEFEHGRSFARVRGVARSFSWFRRALYTALWWMIPFRLLAAILVRNLANRVYFPHFLLSLPLLFGGLISWSFGECIGYLQAGGPSWSEGAPVCVPCHSARSVRERR